MNVIVVLLDSLNKDYLSCYGNEWINSPNVQRLADKGFVFDNHYIGSAPCIPARRELFTGRKEFMWRGWGQTEPFDNLLASEARKTGAFTAVVTDHYHYWNANDGYGYIRDFNYTDMIRGVEVDPHGDIPFEDSDLPQWVRSIGNYRPLTAGKSFYRNAIKMEEEMDFQSPKVMASACDWLDKNAQRDGFYLHIESFDPHEPFYVPEPYRSMYGKYDEKYTCWPPYQSPLEAESFLRNHKDGEVEFVRNQYAGKLTMTDKHLGKVLDMLDEKGLWDNTAVILTTDHGHELFEKNRYGKGYPHYRNVANIPLIIWHPEYPGNGRRMKALTTTVDIYATVLDILGHTDIPAPDGRTLMPLIKGETDKHREAVTFGVFGRGIGMFDGEYTYFSGYDNHKPLYWYSTHFRNAGVGSEISRAHIADATSGKFIAKVDIPVWKIPCTSNLKEDELLFEESDIKQEHNLAEERPECVKKCKEKTIRIMKEEGVPAEQYNRLGFGEQ